MTWAIPIVLILFALNVGAILWIRNRRKESTRISGWNHVPKVKGWGVVNLDYRDLPRARWYITSMFARNEGMGDSQDSDGETMEDKNEEN